MKWQMLKKNRCPQCMKDLAWSQGFEDLENHFSCNCGFKISEKRFREIVDSQINEELQDDEDINYTREEDL